MRAVEHKARNVHISVLARNPPTRKPFSESHTKNDSSDLCQASGVVIAIL